MAKQLFTNNNKTTNAVAILAADLIITLAAGKGALYASPTGGDYQLVTLRDATNIEIVKCTSRTGDALTITRAQESTTAHDFAVDSVIYAGATAGSMAGLLQVDTGGDPSGADALTIQTGRLSVLNVASGERALALGYNSKASGWESLSFGYESVASANYSFAIGEYALASAQHCIAIGANSDATADYAIAFGYGSDATFTNALAVGRTARALKQYSCAFGDAANSNGDYAVALGASARSYGNSSIALGKDSYAEVGADYAIAIGREAVNPVAETSMILGPPIIQESSTRSFASDLYHYSGSKAIIASAQVSLKTVADDVVSLTIPTGAKFFVDKVSVVITASSGITGNPNISFGDSVDTVKLLASTALTKTAAGSREVFDSIDIDGQTSLTVSVKTAAVGTSMSARFYFEGVMIQDET